MSIHTHEKGTLQKLVTLATVLAGLLMATVSFAQSRSVYVNGLRMSNQQVAQLEYYACTHIPNGAYWMNLINGAWGYVGNWNVQGYYGDQCNAPGNSQARQHRKSLSERGMLYSPGEILSGR